MTALPCGSGAYRPEVKLLYMTDRTRRVRICFERVGTPDPAT
jgi:hypothetical protein